MINPKEKLVNMWMTRLITSEDLEKEMEYHKKMTQEYTKMEE